MEVQNPSDYDNQTELAALLKAAGFCYHVVSMMYEKDDYDNPQRIMMEGYYRLAPAPVQNTNNNNAHTQEDANEEAVSDDFDNQESESSGEPLDLSF